MKYIFTNDCSGSVIHIITRQGPDAHRNSISFKRNFAKTECTSVSPDR